MRRQSSTDSYSTGFRLHK